MQHELIILGIPLVQASCIYEHVYSAQGGVTRTKYKLSQDFLEEGTTEEVVKMREQAKHIRDRTRGRSQDVKRSQHHSMIGYPTWTDEIGYMNVPLGIIR